MKITLRLILSLLVGTALIVSAFTYFQVRVFEEELQEDLRITSALVGTSLNQALEPYVGDDPNTGRIEKIVRKFKGDERLLGLVIALPDGTVIGYPPLMTEHAPFQETLRVSMDLNERMELLVQWDDDPIHFMTIPIIKEGTIAGSLGLIHDRSFIVHRIKEVLKKSAIVFSILAVVLSFTTLIIVRWSITGPIAKMAEWTKKVRGGKGSKSPMMEDLGKRGEIDRLLIEVTRMASSLKAVRKQQTTHEAVAEASGETLWTKEKLKEYLRAKLGDHKLYVVANREPYMHKKTKDGIECVVPPSGIVTALDPVLQATGGVWVAHGSGSGDWEVTDAQGRVQVPPEKPAYTLKRVNLTEEEMKGYYYGFSNEGVWPLCHIAHTRPIFRLTDWEVYQKVNERFADALLEEFGDESPYIIIQDYHFAMLPAIIKKKRPDAKIALFWHIPWPNPETFGICPWREEILEGMLGSDVIGFHTQFHCNNFLYSVDQVLESRIDWPNFTVTRSGETTHVRPFPISIDPFPSEDDPSIGEDEIAELKKTYKLEGMMIGVGVDRIDYIKGLLERFIAIERFFEKYPKYQGKMVFVELGAPSRSILSGYQNHLAEIEKHVEKVNKRFGNGEYQPILFLKAHHGHRTIKRFYHMADYCLVNSLHDGMNLVAKEYVTWKEDLNGSLILSRFTGASQELRSALLVNPYDIEQTADAIHQALNMAPQERRERMELMRDSVIEHNVYRWAAELVTELVKAF